MAALTLRDIVAKLGGEAVGEVRSALTGVATLDSAGPGDIAFLANPKYRGRLATTRAGAVILGPGDRDAAAMPRIVSDNPYAYYAKTVALFHPEEPVRPGIHPFAQIDGSATVDAFAEIGAFVVIGAGAVVAKGARIGAHCVLGEGVRIGAGTRLHPRVTIYHGCAVGSRGIVQWFHDGAATERYEGELRAGKPNGHGILTRRNGDHYDGDWRDGKADGAGQVELRSGYRYNGVWAGGCTRDHENNIIAVGTNASTCP